MEIFNQKEKEQINKTGKDFDEISKQLERFTNGFSTIEITESAKHLAGIKKLSKEEIEDFSNNYKHKNCEVIKFVPASGAASRMFKQLVQFLDSKQSISENDFVSKFFQNLSSFAFYEKLAKEFEENKDNSLEKALSENRHKEVLRFILTTEGLNYSNLPKGLLQFHRYENEIRTPSQEHIIEGLAYAQKNERLKLHFTVSPQHQQLFEEHLASVDSNIEISYSIQKLETDTIAVDLKNKPFKKDNGELLFRPAGHGALLNNLNEINADIIFIKNIDNITTDSKRQETIDYKKALAGVLIDFQTKVFDLNKRKDDGENIIEEAKKLLIQLGIKGNLTDGEVLQKLDRPIRVCGVVKNEGEPGGGPFWVKNGETESLQIIEAAQVDKNNPDQLTIFNQSTHFNPVDLVCGVKNYKGEKYDLMQFRDENTGFISVKSFEGKPLKAMELPGLWNGSMADWHTIFVEVPLSTFCPVKTVNDLLKDGHKS